MSIRVGQVSPIHHVSAKTDPAEFADAEVIKAKLEAIESKLDTIIGWLESLVAAIGEKR